MARRRRVSDIFRDCQVYLMERTQKLTQESRFRKSGDPIKKYLKANGVEDPTTGNLQYFFPSPVTNGDGVTYEGVELRKTVGAGYFESDEVRDFIQKLKGGKYLRRVFKMVPQLDTNELRLLHQEGVVTEAQLRSLMHYPKPTYALWPIEVKDSLDE